MCEEDYVKEEILLYSHQLESCRKTNNILRKQIQILNSNLNKLRKELSIYHNTQELMTRIGKTKKIQDKYIFEEEQINNTYVCRIIDCYDTNNIILETLNWNTLSKTNNNEIKMLCDLLNQYYKDKIYAEKVLNELNDENKEVKLEKHELEISLLNNKDLDEENVNLKGELDYWKKRALLLENKYNEGDSIKWLRENFSDETK